MTFDFRNMIDEKEITEYGDIVGFQLNFSDKEYKELIARSSSDIDYDKYVSEGISFKATADLYSDGYFDLNFEIIGGMLWSSSYPITLSSSEEESLLNEMSRVINEKFGLSLENYLQKLEKFF